MIFLISWDPPINSQHRRIWFAGKIWFMCYVKHSTEKMPSSSETHHDRCNNKFNLLNGWQWAKYCKDGKLFKSACSSIGVVWVNDQLFQNNNDIVKAFRTWTENIRSISASRFPREVYVTTYYAFVWMCSDVIMVLTVPTSRPKRHQKDGSRIIFQCKHLCFVFQIQLGLLPHLVLLVFWYRLNSGRHF